MSRGPTTIQEGPITLETLVKLNMGQSHASPWAVHDSVRVYASNHHKKYDTYPFSLTYLQVGLKSRVSRKAYGVRYSVQDTKESIMGSLTGPVLLGASGST